MKANLRQIKKQRQYSDEFKKELVTLYESGKNSVLELEKLYGVSTVVIYRWIYKFSTFNTKGVRVVEMKDSNIKKLKELEKKVQALEQIVVQKQIKIDYLEKVIDIAEEELKIDIKKKSNTSQSTGLENTDKK